MKPLRLALAVCVLLASSLGTEGALAGDGGKKTGQTCHKGLYVNYVDPSTALAFTSESDCTSSLAQTGAVYSISTARCFDPTWKLIKDSSDGSATSGVSCATFVQGGGSLAGTRIVTTGSTVSFTYTFEAFNV